MYNLKNEDILTWETSMKRSSWRHNLFMSKLKYPVIQMINIAQLNFDKGTDIHRAMH